MTACYLHGLSRGTSISEQGNDPRLDIAAFVYQVLRLGALQMVRLPPPPLPRGNAPLFISVLSLPLPKRSQENVCFRSPIGTGFQ